MSFANISTQTLEITVLILLSAYLTAIFYKLNIYLAVKNIVKNNFLPEIQLEIFPADMFSYWLQ